MRPMVALCVSLICCMAGCPWIHAADIPASRSFQPDEPDTVIQLTRFGNLLLVPVQVNDSQPMLFLLDTGTNHMQIAASIITELKLTAVGQVRSDTIGGAVPTAVYPVASIRVGNKAFRHTFACSVNRDQLIYPTIDGILGIAFFKHNPMTIDYANAQLIVHNPHTFKPPSTPAFVVREVAALPAVQVTVDQSATGWFILDTGFSGAIGIEHLFAQTHQTLFENYRWARSFVLGAGGVIRTKALQLNRLDGLHHTWQKIDADIAMKNEATAATYTAGRIGCDLFNNMRLTVDLANHRGWLSPVPQAEINVDTSTDAAGVTPLMRAAHTNRIDQLSQLNAVDYDGANAMFYAVSGQAMDAATRLVQAGIDVNHVTKTGNTALLLAARLGFEPLAKLLLEHGANIDAQDQFGNTALIMAAECGHLSVVQTLLKHSAKLDIITKSYGTALTAAALHGDIPIATVLLKAGADTNAMDVQRVIPPPFYAAIASKQVPMLQLLIEHGADPLVQSPDGQTVLFTAASKGNADIIRLLIEAGVNPQQTDRNGHTAFDVALSLGYADCMKLLYDWDKHAASQP